MDKSDDLCDIVDRKSVLCDKLLNVPDDIKQKFDRLYPNVFDTVTNYLKLVKTDVLDESLEIIEEWWNDLE